MSHGTGLGLERGHERDFVLSTTEEFVKKFNGTRAINKVSSVHRYPEEFEWLNDIMQKIDWFVRLLSSA